MSGDDPVILVVDDSETDALLMELVFERAGAGRPLQYARDGESAIAYLDGTGAYRDRARFPMPEVVLLDLNMPRIDGFEVLAWIRRQPALERLPVYILTASSRSEDIDRAYRIGASSYLVKPSNLNGLMRMADDLLTWLRPLRALPVAASQPATLTTDEAPARSTHATD